MDKALLKTLFIILILFYIPSFANCSVVTSDTVWKGEVTVLEDIIVPEGVTLSIKPGTIIKITPSESTKTDPEYISPLTEITVRGVLKAEGTKDEPIVFITTKEDESSEWAGIIIDGGTASLMSCQIHNAETGIYIMNKGILDIKGSVISGNRYGIVALGEGTNVTIKNTLVKENDYGIFSFRGAKVENSDNIIKDNKKKDLFSQNGKNYNLLKEYKLGEKKSVNREYGDEVLLGDTIWQGRIEIAGIVRIPERSRLIVIPGALVEFKKKDTNGDGIGENGLLIQGVFIAKGTKENPIIFRSAEKNRKMGDWDSINIMNSDGSQNIIEYCQIEDAYRGLHLHFSNMAVNESIFRNNYRGIQFQESAVEIKGNFLYGNKSGIQARDSEVIYKNNNVYNNYYGANFFRVNLKANGNKFLNNFREGLRIKEGVPFVEENLFDGNRYGLLITDSTYGQFNRNIISKNFESGIYLKEATNIEVGGNVISKNFESGISLKKDSNIEIRGNFIQGNGYNGIGIQDSTAVIRQNDISENAKRGIGIISFDGIITENNFIKNGLYAIGLDGKEDVTAPMNWWGGSNVEEVIYDKNDDPSRGRIKYEEIRKDPYIFVWPIEKIAADITWYGDINIKKDVAVLSGTTLALKSGVRVLFSKGAGLKINGKIMAEGEKDKRITFTSLEDKEAGAWNEIFLEHADGSIFSNCDFEYATWGIHSHFTRLTVEDCSFSNNHGGLRFRSGPVEIKHSIFKSNSTGIRSYMGTAVITENVITNNGIGIFVRERGAGLTIKKNNIFANSEYNIRSGDFNDEDIDATGNWWGSGDPADTIFDGRKEPGIGKVNYEPYQKEPFKIDSAGIK
jgi:parallel beta-helix repeat protein